MGTKKNRNEFQEGVIDYVIDRMKESERLERVKDCRRCD